MFKSNLLLALGKVLLLITFPFLLISCGGAGTGDSGDISVIDDGSPSSDDSGGFSGSSARSYTGNASPATEDIQYFREFFWSEVAREDRCGECHADNSVPFAKGENINDDYNVLMGPGLININNPAGSSLFSRLEGHGDGWCWLSSNSACRSALEAYIESWANANPPTSFLSALSQVSDDIDIDEIEEGKLLPDTAPAAYSAAHGLFTAYCSGCHVPSIQSPYFAVDDPETSYQAIKNRIDLNTTENSRPYVRLRYQDHECWSGNCMNDAAQMLGAINAMVDGIADQTISSTIAGGASKAQVVGIQGFVLSGGQRVESRTVGLWDFKEEGGGKTSNKGKFRVAGQDQPLNMPLVAATDGVDWWTSGGVTINNGYLALADEVNNDIKGQFIQQVTGGGQFSIEAWVIPQNTVQGTNADMPASIVSYSAGEDERNFMLSQRAYEYQLHSRDGSDEEAGTRIATTSADDDTVQTSLQHVVAVYSATDGRKFYVNGEDVPLEDDLASGPLTDWQASAAFTLVVGSEATGGRQWLGGIRLLAIHNTALTAENVQTNFDIGVGDKYYTMFAIGHLLDGFDDDEVFIVFQVEVIDDYSYVFNQPVIYFKDETKNIDLYLEGLRVGINTREASSGQAYVNLDLRVCNDSGNSDCDRFESEENAGGMQVLSTVGTLILQEKSDGLNNDQFFITLDSIGPLGSDSLTTREDVVYPTPEIGSVDDADQADIGLKTFAEINASLSALTGIPTTDTLEKYRALQQQLPVTTSLLAFGYPQQMAISQLTFEYCDELVDTNPDYFTGVNFTDSSSSALDEPTEKNNVINPLLSRLWGNGNHMNSLADGFSADQPSSENYIFADTEGDEFATRAALTRLIENIDSDDTATVVKATCAAAFGSAMMLLQ